MSWEMARGPKTYTTPPEPTGQELDDHMATHIPYRSWCKWCIMGRKPNLKHERSQSVDRNVPLLVGDYCFVKDVRDDELVTLYVGRLYPSRSVVAIPVSQKGACEYGSNRLAIF